MKKVFTAPHNESTCYVLTSGKDDNLIVKETQCLFWKINTDDKPSVNILQTCEGAIGILL